MQTGEIAYQLISYRGHGMIEQASSYDANAQVINHERRHLAHFQSVADATGKEVVRESISITYQFVNGRLVPVQGLAEAVLRDKESSSPSVMTAPNNQEDARAMEATPTDPESNPDQKLQEIEQKVKAQLLELERKLEQLERNQQSDPERANLQNKEKYLEQLLAKVQSLKVRANLNNSDATLNKLLDQVVEAVMSPEKLMKAILGLKTGKTQEDKDSSMENKSPKSKYNSDLEQALQALELSVGWMA